MLSCSLCYGQRWPLGFRALLNSGHKETKTEVSEIKKTYQPGDLIPVKNDKGLWGYEQYGELVILHRFQEAGDFEDGLAPVKLNGKFGFINKEGKGVIPYRFDCAGSFSEGLAKVSMSNKWGYIDKSGALVIPFKYSLADDFEDGLAAVQFNGESGFIDPDGQWFRTAQDAKESFAVFARSFVESHVNEWQKKGKYEKTADWQRRVNESSRSAMVDSLFLMSQEEYIKFHKQNLDVECTLGDYDADGEIFMIQDKKFGNILVPVPISEAAAFENQFSSIVRKDKYCIQNDRLGLAEAVFVSPEGKEYKYSNQASLEFSSVDIEYNFEKIELDAEIAEVPRGEQSIKKGTLSIGKSDVDTNIPETDFVNENTFAVIIANENYKREAGVEFAINDGTAFRNYCQKTLGIPEKNIRLSTDATLGDMMGQIDWINSIAKAYAGDANIIFYYAGHGVPDESSKDAYLLPVDGYGTNIATGYKLGSLYEKLSEHPTSSTLVLLDACFSGAKRDGEMMMAARGIAIKAKQEKPTGNMIVFSAAQGDETAYPYKEKGHGLFTYFLLKKLQDTRGNVTLGELSDFISNQVSKRSIIENSKSQTPTVITSGSFENWKELKIK